MSDPKEPYSVESGDSTPPQEPAATPPPRSDAPAAKPRLVDIPLPPPTQPKAHIQALDMLEELHGRGKVVAGYGAPAKGNTLLNYCGIDPTLVPYTVARNPLKVGTYTPGVHIPVLHGKTLLHRAPD